MAEDREILAKARKAAGLTQAELAKAAGVSKDLIASIESGRHRMTKWASDRIFPALATARSNGYRWLADVLQTNIGGGFQSLMINQTDKEKLEAAHIEIADLKRRLGNMEKVTDQLLDRIEEKDRLLAMKAAEFEAHARRTMKFRRKSYQKDLAKQGE